MENTILLEIWPGCDEEGRSCPGRSGCDSWVQLGSTQCLSQVRRLPVSYHWSFLETLFESRILPDHCSVVFLKNRSSGWYSGIVVQGNNDSVRILLFAIRLVRLF